jgi:hypothetical protein
MDEEELTAHASRYYVKVDNIIVPKELEGYKAFEANNSKDLLEKIKKYYGLRDSPEFSIQLWSSQSSLGTRLDILEKIPKEYEFLWVKVFRNKSE